MKKILFILLMPLFCISQTVVNGNYNYTGKMQFSKYKNNLAKDSVLTVDTSGRLILKKFSGANWTDSLQVNNLGGNGNGIVGVDNNGKLRWASIGSNNQILFNRNDSIVGTEKLQTGINMDGFQILAVGGGSDSGQVMSGSIVIKGNTGNSVSLSNRSGGDYDLIFPASSPNDGDVLTVDAIGQEFWTSPDSVAKGYIPLTGTASGKPVTGDIEVGADDYVSIKKSAGSDGGKELKIGFFDDSGLFLQTKASGNEGSIYVSEDRIQINSNSPTSVGLTSPSDFTANITDLDYTQKKYVDTAIANALSATPRVVASGQKSQALVAATTISVTIGATQPSTAYQVTVTPTSALSAALFYVDNKTTTTFDVVYLAGITGTVQFDWNVIR